MPDDDLLNGGEETGEENSGTEPSTPEPSGDEPSGGEPSGGDTPRGGSSGGHNAYGADLTSDMREDWILWEKLLNGGDPEETDPREYAIESGVEAFLNGMIEDPAYQDDALVDGVTTPMLISRESSLEASVKAPPGTDLDIGDLVDALGEDWLCVEKYEDKLGIVNAKLWVCNDILRFQNHSNTVNTRNCVVDDGSYSRRTNDPIAYVPTNTYKVYLSLDEVSQYLYVDKRIAFNTIYDPYGKEILEVYKIIGIDLKSRNFGEGAHLMVLTIQRDVYYEDRDNLEYTLCDLYIDSNDEPTPALTGSCVINGRDVIRIGTTRKYTAVFTDSEGEVVSSVVPIWNATVPTGVTTSVTDGVLSVTVPLSEALVGKEVEIVLSEESQAYGTFTKKAQVITVG